MRSHRSLQAAQIVPVVAGASAPVATAYPHLAGSPVLAPRLAACYKIAMAITMGYMLIMML